VLRSSGTGDSPYSVAAPANIVAPGDVCCANADRDIAMTTRTTNNRVRQSVTVEEYRDHLMRRERRTQSGVARTSFHSDATSGKLDVGRRLIFSWLRMHATSASCRADSRGARGRRSPLDANVTAH
jgi:hypothetical protein